MRKGIIGVAVIVAVVVGGLGLAVVVDGDDGGGGPFIDQAAALSTFDTCDALLAELQDQALAQVGPYGLDGGIVVAGDGIEEQTFEEGDVATTDDGGEADGAPAPTTTVPSPAPASGEESAENAESAESGGDTEFSTTNVQVLGVDEPDLVKTDGERLVAVAGGEVRVFDVSGDEPVAQGSVDLPADGTFELLVEGDRALLLGPSATGTVLAEVDLSNPEDPAIVETATVDGAYLTARQVDDVARVVVTTPAPELGFVFPSAGGAAAEEVAEQANREVIQQSTLEDWLPQASFDDGDPSATVPCEQVSVPQEPSGFGTATVLTVDLSQPLALEEGTSVIGGSEVVYASDDNLYVATTALSDPEQGTEGDDDGEDVFVQPSPATLDTAIHRFALPADGPAVYEASGTVPGRMLDQFSFSEFEGHLRVATTVDEPEGPVSRLTVLAVDDLRGVGSVGDIGEGEELYAVRMLGPVGYAVTFLQTDPLFTLDLSDPADPEVVGELEIPGYSSYLHPISDDLLLGIGQAGTEGGVLTGTQVSLFDVSDPASPERIQQYEVEGGSSEAEYDHRAFLWWADTNLAVLPVEVHGSDEHFTGAIGVHVDRDGIDEVGRIEHGPAEDCPPAPVPTDIAEVSDIVAEPTSCDLAGGLPILRSLVVGDALLTVSDSALQAADLDTLEPTAEVAF